MTLPISRAAPAPHSLLVENIIQQQQRLFPLLDGQVRTNEPAEFVCRAHRAH
jgi:hypothetical protein